MTIRGWHSTTISGSAAYQASEQRKRKSAHPNANEQLSVQMYTWRSQPDIFDFLLLLLIDEPGASKQKSGKNLYLNKAKRCSNEMGAFWRIYFFISGKGGFFQRPTFFLTIIILLFFPKKPKNVYPTFALRYIVMIEAIYH